MACTARTRGIRNGSAWSGSRNAERTWPGLDPIGRRFTRENPAEKPFEIVDVCADGYPSRLDVPAPMMVYVPYSYRSRTRASLVIRAGGDLSSLTGAVRTAIWRVDPEIAIANARPLGQVVDAAVGGRRDQAMLFVGLGFVVILITTLGVYAVTMVRVRFSPVAAGLAAGIAGALALGSIVGACCSASGPATLLSSQSSWWSWAA